MTGMSVLGKWKRYSLRSALLIITIICFWLGWQTHLFREQARALVQIRELGGTVTTAAEKSSFFARLVDKNSSIDAASITHISFLGLAVGDSAIDDIARCTFVLPNLESIIFMETAITPDGERRLQAKLPSVQIQVITPILRGQDILRRVQ